MFHTMLFGSRYDLMPLADENIGAGEDMTYSAMKEDAKPRISIVGRGRNWKEAIAHICVQVAKKEHGL